MATRVPLRSKTGTVRAVAVVDDEDAVRVLSHRWYLAATGYPVRTTDKLTLHRFVMDLIPGDGKHCDHINRDKLDARRQNLRVVTQAQNQQNLDPRGLATNTSGFRGVGWHPRAGKWRARIKLHGQEQHLGLFTTAEAAGAAVAAARARTMPFSEADRHEFAQGDVGRTLGL